MIRQFCAAQKQLPLRLSAAFVVAALCFSSPVEAKPNPCKRMLNPSARITREQLKAFLSVRHYSPREQVYNILGSGYCQVSESGIAYPLAFNPSTFLLVIYDGSYYVTYDYIFNVPGMGL